MAGKVFVCPECDKEFTAKEAKQLHGFVCDDCGAMVIAKTNPVTKIIIGVLNRARNTN